MIKPLRDTLIKNIKESSLFSRKTSTNDLYIKLAFEFIRNNLNIECISVEDNGSTVVINKAISSNNRHYLKEEIRIKSDLLGSGIKKIHFKGFNVTDEIYILPIGEINGIEFLMDDESGTLDSNLHLYVYGNFGSFRNCKFSAYNVHPFVSSLTELPDKYSFDKNLGTMPIYEWIGGKIQKGLIPFKRPDKMGGKDVFEVLYGNGNKFITKNALIVYNFYICLDKNNEQNRKMERLPKSTLNKTYSNYNMEDIWDIGGSYTKSHVNLLSTTYQKKIMEYFSNQMIINYKFHNIQNYNYDMQNNIGVVIEK